MPDMGSVVRALVLLCLIPLVLFASPAHAAELGASTLPADGSILSATPREIVITLGQDPQESVVVVLTDADSGAVVPFTGMETPVPSGREVRVFPPALEPGTYAVTWSYESESGPRQGVSSFSIGAPSAAVVTFGEGPSGGASGWLPAALVVLGSVLLASWVVTWSRRRQLRLPLVVAVVSVVVAFAAVSLPWWWRAATAATGLLCLLTLWVRPRFVLPPVALALASLGGFGLATFGPLPWVSAVLGAVGAAAFALLLGPALAVSVSPGRAMVVMRTAWPVPVLAALLLPALWAGAWVSRQANLQDRFSAAVPIGVSVLLFAVALPLAGTAILLLLRRRARPASVVSGVAVALLSGCLVAVFPPSAQEASSRVLDFDASSTAQQCLGEGDRLSTTICLQNLFAAKSQQAGVIPALNELRDAMGQAPSLRFFCHETAHAIGRSSLVVHEGQIEAAFADGYDVCDFGYYHGIIEASSSALSDREFAAAVPTLCADLASVDRLFFLQCTHGLGHAAARRANNDIVRALEFCDAIESSPAYPQEMLDGALNACGTGVTMEWFAVAGAVGRADGSAVSPAVDSLRDVCLVVPDRWEPECLEYVGNTLDTGRPRESLTELAAWCLTTDYPASCFNGLARAAAGVGLAPEDAIEVCALAGSGRRECLRDYLLTVSTTIDYSVRAVDRICLLLPRKDRDGNGSVCDEARRLTEEILAASDGKVDPSDPAIVIE